MGNVSDIRGIALIMVMWVITVLMVIVLSFSVMTRTETFATIAFKEGIEERLLAEAGIERGITELIFRNVNKGQTVILEGKEPWKADNTPYTVEIAGGSVTISIMDEAGKIDINQAPEIVLKNFFSQFGMNEEQVNILVDSIMDWKDADNLHRLNGAEDEYYQSLPVPYKAKNANFDAVEELILVRGMTPEILYGTPENPGAINFLTVHSKIPLINLESAPKEVLDALPGMSAEVLDELMQRKNADNPQTGQITTPVSPALAQYARYGAGGRTFTIDAAGHRKKDAAGYRIRATVTLENNNTFKYLYYKSPTIAD